MNNTTTRYLIIAFAGIAVLFPLWTRIKTLTWAFDATLLPNLFPLFGITAFTLLWLHSLSGVFEPWLRQHINFDRFVNSTATIILICIVLHPLLLLALLGFNVFDLFLIYENLWLWIGIIGWLLLITYDIGKYLKKYFDFFALHWNKILIISNIGFLLTFFHSLYLGSDLQANPLRAIWIFYGVTAICAIVYTYGIRRFLHR